jgi:hypothetical protein
MRHDVLILLCRIFWSCQVKSSAYTSFDYELFSITHDSIPESKMGLHTKRHNNIYICGVIPFTPPPAAGAGQANRQDEANPLP